MSIEDLIKSENCWKTSMGLSFPGERVVLRGKDLFDELGEKSWMEVLLYGITGKEFTQEQIKLFEGIWVNGGSYPDPRIWNNRVTALAGTVRSTGSLAISSAVAVSEAKSYGQHPLIRMIDFLIKCKKEVDKGTELTNIIFSELKKYRMLPGYGRPIISHDERNKPLMKLAKKLGLDGGCYTKLAFEIEHILLKRKYRYKLNGGGLSVALIADQGLSQYESYLYLVYCFSGGFFPCYIDSLKHKEGCFFPFSCESISYSGETNKKW